MRESTRRLPAGADAARGTRPLRLDHGTQYLSDHFVNQVRFWEITPSFAFVQQPQTNGVAERFIRTLKEQVVYGRTFRGVEDLRAAIRAFIVRYNQHWLVEKNGFRSPAQGPGRPVRDAVPVAA
jgi:transposase InsO family protein